MADEMTNVRKLTIWLTVSALVAAVLAVGVTALLVNVMERKQEGRNPFFRVVPLNDNITDPAVWGKDFPMQYDRYLRTTEQVRTRYGGSEAIQRTPTAADPRTVIAESKLDEDPRLRTMWAGYAFSKDYRARRGHAWMLADQTFTERQHAVKQPGTCVNCHASMWVAYKQAGHGDIFKGFDAINSMPYFEARKLVSHPVACIDCHDPETMQLRVTRPAFISGLRAFKNDASYDPNTMASRQEMRSYVCGQCHVEYYFKGPAKTLVYPWSNGLQADEILDFYEQAQQTDWVHGETGAKSLKAQHPEFETWSMGIHARSGVACADCHMPYTREGAMKISDHHVQSPLLNINRACQTCHRWPEEELKTRVETIQTRTVEMRNTAMDALIALINDIKEAKAEGMSPAQIEIALAFQRKAQFLVDFVASENSTGFHAPQEAARVLTQSIDYSRRGEMALRGLTPMTARTSVTLGVLPRGDGQAHDQHAQTRF